MALHTPQGTDAGTPNGDYISDDDGLGTFYRYFIEVPPSVGRLVVEVFDADVGRGGGSEDTAGRDRDRNDGYDTETDYSLIRPDGSTAATLNNCDDGACDDNAWDTILNSTTTTNTAAGHWELRVAMDGANDINAIGIRAHDGTSGAGGTELPVYYDSHAQIGVNPPSSGGGSRSYTLYPYLTAGCSAAKNDFDFDSNSGNVGSMALTSRDGNFVQNYASGSLSTNNVWRRDTFSGWTSDQRSMGYGIWNAAVTINTYTTPAVNGNYANVWFSNYQAAGNPPAANPTTNAFRVYLPTDAGGTPVKPYLEQFVNHLSGPNPVGAGQTSRYRVTVGLVNPTTRPIVFSASNLIRSNVPGSGVVYAGGATVTQGSITAQPSIGGTGNITWNPGTVAAGAIVFLRYQVDVSPSSGGQRLIVTATPTSGNGTRATYVDETGNTTQARATYTLGPICELAVTAGLVTEAVVSSVHGSPAADGGVLLEWTTASEVATAGFVVERWEASADRWAAVHTGLLAGVQAAQGGRYHLVDEAASPYEPLSYRLVEVEATGSRRVHGPFAVAVDWSRSERNETGESYQRQAFRAAGKRDAAVNRSGVFTSALPANGETHLEVRESGLYHLSAVEMASWLGLPLYRIETMIEAGELDLSLGGKQVAWYPNPDGKTPLGLYFFGEASKSPYRASNAYHLRADAKGRSMAVVNVASASPAAEGTFPESLHLEVDALPATGIVPDPEADYWFWQFLQGGDPTFGQRTFSLDAPDVGAGTAVLRASLHGGTTTGVANEHVVSLSLNGTLLGTSAWTGVSAHQVELVIPSGVLVAGNNVLQVSAQVGGGAPFSVWYVDSFDLTYSRRLRARSDELTFSLPAGSGKPQASVRGFSTPAVRLLDISDPLRPIWLRGASTTMEARSGLGDHVVTFGYQSGARYLAVAATAAKSPTAVRPWNKAGLLDRANRADYLVITTPALREAAEELADLRREQGLEALVVDIDQIMDELNAGLSSPHALRAFVTWTQQHWSLPPRYVVLAGHGTFDYRDLLGFGGNLVPPLLIRATGGLFPADARLGDSDGDGVPEVVVGRIPVSSPAELETYTAKIEAYERDSAPDWAAHVMLLSDAADRGADFAADNTAIGGQLPGGYLLEEVDLGSQTLATARTQLFGGIERGTAYINYLGHGGLDRLAAAGLLTNADVPGLSNDSRLPVLTAMTCTVNRFELPGFPSLGELLVNRSSGGTAAVWGPAGLADTNQAELLATRFYHLVGSPGERLGDLILRAVKDFAAAGGDMTLPPTYILLGDPALRLVTPPIAEPMPSKSEE